MTPEDRNAIRDQLAELQRRLKQLEREIEALKARPVPYPQTRAIGRRLEARDE